MQRIGIDVGGTFTHGILLDPDGNVSGRSVTPTTHDASRGVADGIRTVLAQLLEGRDGTGISLVAHSTTQATNALLEGDVSDVRRIVITLPGEDYLPRMNLRDKFIEIGSGNRLNTTTDFVSFKAGVKPDADFSDNELPVAVIQPLASRHQLVESSFRDELGLDKSRSVLASDITQVLGIKARSRTAVINAAMLPSMLDTARYTKSVVKEMLPHASLQVVRSDGGAMGIDELEQQPILSIMSGPAAGASAALHRSGLSELLFIEVGGTSTDVTLIEGGRVRHRNATVGGNRLLVPALDLRTIALGGGSMLNSAGKLFGPRSAHIAGLPYLFQAMSSGKKPVSLSDWKDQHGTEYKVVRMDDDSESALTITDYALMRQSADNPACQALLTELGLEIDASIPSGMNDFITSQGLSPEAAYSNSIQRLALQMRELLKGHNSKGTGMQVVGGGGGAPTILEATAQRMDMPFQLVAEHKVISAIGAALAVTTASMSRSTSEPAGSDIEELTKEVERRLSMQGANRVDTQYEFDPQRQILTVTGRGSMPYESENKPLTEDELLQRAATLLDSPDRVWSGPTEQLYLSYTGRNQLATALNRNGRSLWTGFCRRYVAVPAGKLDDVLAGIIREETLYTDGGALLPGLALLVDGRLIPLDQLGSAELISEILRWEKIPVAAEAVFILS